MAILLVMHTRFKNPKFGEIDQNNPIMNKEYKNIYQTSKWGQNELFR